MADELIIELLMADDDIADELLIADDAGMSVLKDFGCV